MTPERVAKLTEDETKTLYDWAMGVLEKLLHLDPEKKCEIANEAMKKVWMPRIRDQVAPNVSSGTTNKRT